MSLHKELVIENAYAPINLPSGSFEYVNFGYFMM